MEHHEFISTKNYSQKFSEFRKKMIQKCPLFKKSAFLNDITIIDGSNSTFRENLTSYLFRGQKVKIYVNIPNHDCGV